MNYATVVCTCWLNLVEIDFNAGKVKVNQSHYSPELPKGFQEVLKFSLERYIDDTGHFKVALL